MLLCNLYNNSSCLTPAGCETLSESFDRAQDERTNSNIVEDFPFMLRFSKHSDRFFGNLLPNSLLNMMILDTKTFATYCAPRY